MTGKGSDHREQVQAGVDAHVAVAPLPVEHRGQRLAGFRQRLGVARDMHHLALVLAVDRGGDGDIAARPAKPPGVAGLAAAGGVEHRAVEHDAAAVVDGKDGGLGFGKVGVAAEEEFGGHGDWSGDEATQTSRLPREAASGERHCDVVFASSHAGTGRPRSRRKSGLKSFDW